MRIDGGTSRQVAVRSVPIHAKTSSGLLDDFLPTLFIPATFKSANAVQIRVSIDEIELEVWCRLMLKNSTDQYIKREGIDNAAKVLVPNSQWLSSHPNACVTINVIQES